ncbi:unnamed protein product [Schistosoma margrebowiei]|uniref:Uncharacterized protein n=1 Tax=Schistosoma margrebowiei TaxID=48269 RepID=A0A183N5C8_9TREM|nr:unnamed protein product [Schistosoma margrebowiei]
MWKTGKTSQITTEVRRYKLAVLGISETHWTQAGQQRLNTGKMLLYSGHEEENAPHTQRAALMLSKVARNAIVGWECHGSRIIKASFKTKKEGITMNVIQCYSPNNNIDDDNKDRFYERLYSKPEKPVKDKECRPINEIQQQRNRSVEYFEDLLNRPATLNPTDVEAAHTDLLIHVPPQRPKKSKWPSNKSRAGKQQDPKIYQLKH